LPLFICSFLYSQHMMLPKTILFIYCLHHHHHHHHHVVLCIESLNVSEFVVWKFKTCKLGSHLHLYLLSFVFFSSRFSSNFSLKYTKCVIGDDVFKILTKSLVYYNLSAYDKIIMMHSHTTHVILRHHVYRTYFSFQNELVNCHFLLHPRVCFHQDKISKRSSYLSKVAYISF